MRKDLINKMEKAGLVGRGGAEYPTARKWLEVKHASGSPKYVICNASEGELGLFKDLYILKNYPEKVAQGMVLALDYLKSKQAFFSINQKYYRQLRPKLTKLARKYNRRGYNIQFFPKEPSYIGGEETALLNAIEGKRTEPRLKPPYPSLVGLFGKPTLINNVETFYNVACLKDNTFIDNRFYSISGKVKNKGVYFLPADMTVEEILKKTDNCPGFEFFVQVGGSAAGPVFNSKQIKKQKMVGAGGLEVYDKKTNAKKIILRWIEFYQKESCGKCGPCRTGTYQLYNLVRKRKNIPWKELFEVFESTEQTSFCALGKSVSFPVLSYYKNVFKKQ